MKPGFYSISVASAERPDEMSRAILSHFADGRFVGVDQGGCRLHGRYESDADGRVAVHLIYDFKGGSELVTGVTIPTDTRHRADLLLAPATLEGRPQPIDLGLGASLIQLEWIAPPVGED